jgi:hypothetical protein
MDAFKNNSTVWISIFTNPPAWHVYAFFSFSIWRAGKSSSARLAVVAFNSVASPGFHKHRRYFAGLSFDFISCASL